MRARRRLIDRPTTPPAAPVVVPAPAAAVRVALHLAHPRSRLRVNPDGSVTVTNHPVRKTRRARADQERDE